MRDDHQQEGNTRIYSSSKTDHEPDIERPNFVTSENQRKKVYSDMLYLYNCYNFNLKVITLFNGH